jgi:GntR family transcriptional repressor for pyruvate dehydrogenase complex
VGLPGEAIDKIKEMILSGRLSPGDRLPREQDLAAELGMSRNMLREAVTALSLINVLDVRRGDGTYVTTLSPQLLLDALTFIADFQRDDTVLNFIEVRKMLEPLATAQAAVQISADEVASLGEHVETMVEDIPVDDLVLKDAEFHRRIIDAAGNPILSSVLETMSRPLHQARVWRDLLEQGAFERTRKEHLAILDALRRSDAGDARAWSHIHISATEQWLRLRVAASNPRTIRP